MNQIRKRVGAFLSYRGCYYPERMIAGYDDACLTAPRMKATFHTLASADESPWKDSVSASDGLPIRDSGAWIETKHRLLTYYAHLFATGMRYSWKSRVYLELFSGPGRCLIRKTGKEDLGSPLKVIEHQFTKFIFTEMSLPAAEALAQRLEPFENATNTEIWCGDCADAIQKIRVPAGSLTLAFIDPTGIGHAPFSLIEALHRKTRCDLLINIQHGMGIKMNIHHYTPDADEQSALTKFLGNDLWKQIPRHNPREFFRGVQGLYKKQLDKLGFSFVGREVFIANDNNTPLYLLLYASKHPKGKEFWDKAMKGVLPMEFDFGS
ncbi:MAG: three-Cys-motif partner protein TcmP [Verrucomicrobia bacterium]|nr:three-Cys-motif partner protein TcmP [Verrucomicrobiota bacterium]